MKDAGSLNGSSGTIACHCSVGGPAGNSRGARACRGGQNRTDQVNNNKSAYSNGSVARCRPHFRAQMMMMLMRNGMDTDDSVAIAFELRATDGTPANDAAQAEQSHSKTIRGDAHEN